MSKRALVALAAFVLLVLSVVSSPTPASSGGINAATSLAGRWQVTITCRPICFSTPRDKVSQVTSTVILRPIDSYHPNIYQDTYLNSYLYRDLAPGQTAITYRLDYDPVVVYVSSDGLQMYGKFCSCILKYLTYRGQPRTLTGSGIKVVEGDRKISFTTTFNMVWTYKGPLLLNESHEPLSGTNSARVLRPLHDGGRPVCG